MISKATKYKIKEIKLQIIKFKEYADNIKKECEAIANSVKIFTYDAFIITDPDNATRLSLEQYNQSYTNTFNTLSEKYYKEYLNTINDDYYNFLDENADEKISRIIQIR